MTMSGSAFYILVATTR